MIANELLLTRKPLQTIIIYMFRAIWEFAQSADCVAQTEDPQNACQSADYAILIEQTVEPQVLLQQPQILPMLY